MTRSFFAGFGAAALLALGAAGVWHYRPDASPAPVAAKPNPPAAVAKVVGEDSLNTVVLKPESEKLLGVKTAPAVRKDLPAARVYGAEAIAPPGATALAAAPMTGTLRYPAAGARRPGQTVRKGEPILELLPLLTPEGRATMSTQLAEAEGNAASAKTATKAALEARDRAKGLYEDQAGSKRLYEEAQAAYDLAQENERTLAAKAKELAGSLGSAEARPVVLTAPLAGVLRNLAALPGQQVPSGAALFEVVDLSTVWIRVPVPVGDLAELDRTAAAEIGPLGAAPGPQRQARPAAAPPSANALAGTADLFYELPNPDGAVAPGERLGATLRLRGSGPTLSVPASALVYDVHGNVWAYVRTAPATYVRRRVSLDRIAGADAALARGPAPGAEVVVAGAVELFGAETGFKK